MCSLPGLRPWSCNLTAFGVGVALSIPPVPLESLRAYPPALWVNTEFLSLGIERNEKAKVIFSVIILVLWEGLALRPFIKQIATQSNNSL